MRMVVHLLLAVLAGWLACRPGDAAGGRPRGGSAALVLLASLLAAAGGLWLASTLSLALPRSEVIGRWTVLNSDEPNLMAVWDFSPAPRSQRAAGPLVVRGAICLAEHPGRADDPATWCGLNHFGPHPAQLDAPAGRIEFNYGSELGAGTVRLTLAQAYVGRLVDDPARTSVGQADTAAVALVREAERGRSSRRAHRLANLWNLLFASWLSLAVLRLLRWRRKVEGDLACWLLFAALTVGCSATLGTVDALVRKSRGVETGDHWLLEYLSHRGRVGNFTTAVEQGQTRLEGSLATRQRLGRGGFRTGPLSHDLLRRQLRFDYQAEAGVGRGNLVRTPALYGYFFDLPPGAARPNTGKAESFPDHPCPRACGLRFPGAAAEPNFGDLIALRTTLPLGSTP